ncbi:MAG TPA: hypothetical protein PLW50_00135 [Smithellaceae bacterium]|nr:hypothetical protein [Smithellaceae bacterium]
MTDFNMYSVYASLRDARTELQAMERDWDDKYPDTLKDVDFSRVEEEFFKTKELRERGRELDRFLEDSHTTLSMIYDIQKLMDSLVAKTKFSRLMTRDNINYIDSCDGDIREASKMKKIHDQEDREREAYRATGQRGKRRAHRR